MYIRPHFLSSLNKMSIRNARTFIGGNFYYLLGVLYVWGFFRAVKGKGNN